MDDEQVSVIAALVEGRFLIPLPGVCSLSWCRLALLILLRNEENCHPDVA